MSPYLNLPWNYPHYPMENDPYLAAAGDYDDVAELAEALTTRGLYRDPNGERLFYVGAERLSDNFRNVHVRRREGYVVELAARLPEAQIPRVVGALCGPGSRIRSWGIAQTVSTDTRLPAHLSWAKTTHTPTVGFDPGPWPLNLHPKATTFRVARSGVVDPRRDYEGDPVQELPHYRSDLIELARNHVAVATVEEAAAEFGLRVLWEPLPWELMRPVHTNDPQHPHTQTRLFENERVMLAPDTPFARFVETLTLLPLYAWIAPIVKAEGEKRELIRLAYPA